MKIERYTWKYEVPSSISGAEIITTKIYVMGDIAYIDIIKNDDAIPLKKLDQNLEDKFVYIKTGYTKKEYFCILSGKDSVSREELKKTYKNFKFNKQFEELVKE